MERVRYANLFYFKLWLYQFQGCPSPPWIFVGHLASRWSPLLAKHCPRLEHLFVYSTKENFLSVLCNNAFLFYLILERIRFMFMANIIFLLTLIIFLQLNNKHMRIVQNIIVFMANMKLLTFT